MRIHRHVYILESNSAQYLMSSKTNFCGFTKHICKGLKLHDVDSFLTSFSAEKFVLESSKVL